VRCYVHNYLENGSRLCTTKEARLQVSKVYVEIQAGCGDGIALDPIPVCWWSVFSLRFDSCTINIHFLGRYELYSWRTLIRRFRRLALGLRFLSMGCLWRCGLYLCAIFIRYLEAAPNLVGIPSCDGVNQFFHLQYERLETIWSDIVYCCIMAPLLSSGGGNGAALHGSAIFGDRLTWFLIYCSVTIT